MSSFSSKLGRVDLRGFTGAKPGEPAPAAADEPPRAPPADAASPAADPPTLDELRGRIARILGKSAPPPRPTRDPTAGELPFAREDTASGPLHVRMVRLSPAHRVGRAPLRAATAAGSGLLALLALDPTLADRPPARALFVDTETTGLSGGTGTIPFLIGLAWFEEGSGALVVEQLLLRRLGEEAPMLERLAERVRAASMLVSFNGKSFDLPLLRTRMVMHRLPPLEEPPHLDLVHVARRIHKGRLAQHNLGTIESRVLGFEREGDIPSGEVVGRWQHYLRTGDDSALLAVVEHNHWDVISMAALVGLYGEPLDGLAPADLVGVARTLRRARALDDADLMVDAAVDRGGGDDAIRARGEIAKARGDKARALAAFASVVGKVDDAALRLELAKLYEHHARAPLHALALAMEGTGEAAPAWAKRVDRLQRKASRTPRERARRV